MPSRRPSRSRFERLYVEVALVAGSRASALRLLHPEDVAAVAGELIGASPREVMLAFLFNAKLGLNGVYRVGVGTVDHVLASPREVFQAALLANATSIALVHNHPSGDVGISKPDITLTRRMCDAGRVLGVGVEDHVVVTAGGAWESMRRVCPDLPWAEEAESAAADG